MTRLLSIHTIGSVGITAVLVVLLLIPPQSPEVGEAASHREAPLIALDPEADITDVFFFRSYEAGKADRVVLIMNVIPGEEPSSGPNYWNFDPTVLYAFNIDNDADGQAEDVVFEFQFTNEFRGTSRDLGLFLPDVALPPITALDGPGSEGLGQRQRYSVTMVRNKGRQTLAEGLIAVPSNVGPRTMPNYDALAAQGIYTLPNDIRVFAGQRQDPFYIDLGGVFDTLNLRRNPPLLTAAEDANDGANPFGVDMLSGFNVHTIALEVPASLLTRDRRGPDQRSQAKLGLYASTSRRTTTVLRERQGPSTHGPWVQVQRLANPLVNELIIATTEKDRWNALEPEQERQFLDFYLSPRLAVALETVYGVPAGKTGRTDLRDLLLTYGDIQLSDRPRSDAPTAERSRPDARLSELLRLDLEVPPAPLAAQKRLGRLAHDAAGNPTPDLAGWPNGRRPKDDVTDLFVRIVGGSNYINGRAGDGVNVDDAALPATFPFLATPADGRNRVHTNPAP